MHKVSRTTLFKNNPPSYLILTLTVGLVFFGVVALGSASTQLSLNNYGNSYYYLVHQLLLGVLPGLILMALLSKLDYHAYKKLAPILLVVSFLLLIAILIPGVGISAGGAKRWISLGFTTIQPSELMKLTMIIYLASWFDKKQNSLREFTTGFLPSLIVVLLAMGLIYFQPDLGTLLTVCLIAAAMFFTAGSRLKHLLATAFLGVVALLIAIKMEPYRVARVVTFLDPSHDPQGVGYHVNQALLAVGSGGLFGLGYNHSLQKHNFLPEPMGDSIFAIIAEEMGFIRSAVLIVMFSILAYAGLRIAKNAPDNFGKLLAVGLTSWVVLQAFINIGAMLAILPLTGIPLPFISYGSSSLIMTLAGMGVLLNISRQSAT